MRAPLSSPRVAFQGALGAFGEEAIHVRWRGAAIPVPARTFAEVVALVRDGTVESGVLPIWNSLIGGVAPGLEALFDALDAQGRPALHVVGQVAVLVRHHLLALPGTSLARARVAGGHAVALSQCARFFAATPHLAPRVAYDSAGAAMQLAALRSAEWATAAREVGEVPWYEELALGGDDELAVIASHAAARRYGLEVLAEDVQDSADNVTRFVVLVRADVSGDDG